MMLSELKAKITAAQDEILKSVPGTPHYRDTCKHLNRLQKEYQGHLRRFNIQWKKQNML